MMEEGNAVHLKAPESSEAKSSPSVQSNIHEPLKDDIVGQALKE
jgi:hypothetical protein